MPWWVLGAAAIIGAVVTFYLWRKRALIRKMTAAVDLVKIGLFKRLYSSYVPRMQSDDAASIAAAVVNYVFSEQASKSEADRWAHQHQALIERQARRLREDADICEAVTQAVRVRTLIAYARGEINEDRMTAALERLKQLGLLIPGGEAPNPGTFLPLAAKFDLSSQNEGHGPPPDACTNNCPK